MFNVVIGIRYKKKENGQEYTMFALQMVNSRDNEIQVFMWSQDNNDGQNMAAFIGNLYSDLYEYSFVR